jgi:pimeloyl-ACP methyl ester carboxylesterase
MEPDRIDRMILVGVGGRFLPDCRESMAAAEAESYSQAWWDIMRARHAYGDEQIREIVEYLRSFADNETDVNFAAADLATIRAETLIVQGDQDWCFPPSLAAELFQEIPSANLWVIPNGEHVPILGEHAARFLDVALRFLGEG